MLVIEGSTLCKGLGAGADEFNNTLRREDVARNKAADSRMRIRCFLISNLLGIAINPIDYWS